MHRLHSSAAAAMHGVSLVSVVATAGLGAQARLGEIGEIAFALTSASWMRAASTPWCRAAAMARPSRVRSALATAASSSFFASVAYGVQGGGPDGSTPGKWASQGQTTGQGEMQQDGANSIGRSVEIEVWTAVGVGILWACARVGWGGGG